MSPVSLAPATRADAADLIQGNVDSRAYHAPWAEPFTDWDGFQRWFGGLLTPANVGLVARAEGAIVGVVNISQIVRGAFQSAYLGYYGMRPMAGRGLMTEAVRLATRYAFDELGLHRLEANIQPGNAASLALAARLGFRREEFSPRYLRIAGDWRDHERWALLADVADHAAEITRPSP
jgi:ribosomal-protein-alanine N-acetyltransferase